jgi:ATP-dependent Lon protease
LASAYGGVPVRSDTAMTGEITLSGLVLPIGAVKEKVLAARRAGLKRVVLPRDNEKDTRELPENVRKEMEIVFVERIGELLAAVLPGLHAGSTRVPGVNGADGPGQMVERQSTHPEISEQSKK